VADAWTSASAYEAYIGRWSRLLAPRFLAWAGVPRGAAVLDVGSGSGALSAALLALAPSRLEGIDRSEAYVAATQSELGPKGARFQVADAMALPHPDGTFDAAVSGLVLNFVPDPAKAAGEMRRVVRPGGLVAAYVWDYEGRMEMVRTFWEQAVALDPAAARHHEGARFPLCQPGPLQALFEGAGLEAVRTAPLDQPTVFRDFDDYWGPFLGGQGPAAGYAMALPEERRAALRERLRATLPAQPDGRIALVARAWAVRGRVPQNL
jgi:SAM-dependent methyltransferase